MMRWSEGGEEGRVAAGVEDTGSRGEGDGVVEKSQVLGAHATERNTPAGPG
jgi:hypothetical protein